MAAVKPDTLDRLEYLLRRIQHRHAARRGNITGDRTLREAQTHLDAIQALDLLRERDKPAE